MEYFTRSAKISSKTQYFQEMPKALFTDWQCPGMNSSYLIHQHHSRIVWFRAVWFRCPSSLCSFVFVGYLFRSVCLSVSLSVSLCVCVCMCVCVLLCFFVNVARVMDICLFWQPATVLYVDWILWLNKIQLNEEELHNDTYFGSARSQSALVHSWFTLTVSLRW